MRWSPHVTVAAVIMQDDRFLMVHENINGKSVINQPAGHLENNETLCQAVIRETMEETCWHFEPAFLLGVYQWSNQEQEMFIRYCFTGHITDKNPEQVRDPVIQDVVWHSQEELQNSAHLRSPLVLQCINDYYSGKRYNLDVLKSI